MFVLSELNTMLRDLIIIAFIYFYITNFYLSFAGVKEV